MTRPITAHLLRTFVPVFVSVTVHAETPTSAPDGDMQKVLATFEQFQPKPIESLSASAARRQPTMADAALMTAEKEGKPTQPLPLAEVRALVVPLDGRNLSARLYIPEAGEGLPLVVYFHGGGWVIGSIDTYDSSARLLATMSKAIVLAPEYRKAPEDPFPAPADDAYDTVQWAIKNAPALGANPAKVAVAGESAGGTLALVSSYLAKLRHGEMPMHQLLIYPVADTRTDTDSYRRFGATKPLSTAMMKWFFSAYLPVQKNRGNSWAFPLTADLSGLPPTTIINAALDPLADDGRALFRTLKSQGVPVERKEYSGVTHEFFGMGLVVDKAAQAEKYAASRLTSAFSKRAQKRGK